MRRSLSTIVLLVVLAALGGYVYYKESGKEDAQKLEDAKRKVFKFEGKDINEIKIVQDGLTVTGARKNDKDWVISEPAGIEADSGEWETLASHIAGLEKEKVVNENATDLAQFGLSKPVVQLSVKLKEGEPVDIFLGDENPMKTLRYARLSTSSEVFLSPNSINNFRKSLTDLRNKTVIEIVPDDVDRFTILEGGKKKASFRRVGEDWLMDSPVEAKAEASAISTFLGLAQFARATDFADASIDAKKAGLDAPAFGITLHDSKAQTEKTLTIGKEKQPGSFYAKDASRPMIFVIDKQLPDKLRLPVADWRDKTIAKVDKEKIDEIEIVRGADKIALKKTGGEWKLGDGKKASGDKVVGLIDILDFERAREIIDAPKAPATYGLDKPRVQVSLREGGKDTVRLTFGGDAKPEGVYVKKGDGPVLVVAKELMDRYVVSAGDFEEKVEPPATFAPPPGK
jgi:hypothetical protein